MSDKPQQVSLANLHEAAAAGVDLAVQDQALVSPIDPGQTIGYYPPPPSEWP